MIQLPIDALQKAMYSFLSKYETVPVYDNIPDDAMFPYITFGDFEYNPDNAKAMDMSSVTVELDIYSDQPGRAEVNQIANELCQLFSAVPVVMEEEQFKIQRQEIVSYTSYPAESFGYSGKVIISFLIYRI